MKPEQQRVAIAEACGWRIQEHVSPECKDEAIMCWIRPNGNDWQPEKLPDYCNSLDAMHEAEKVLNNGQIVTYIQWLPRGAFSTAAQRAEAFLRTIGKWTE